MTTKLKSNNKARVLKLASERHRRHLIRTRNHALFVELYKESRPILKRKPREYADITFHGVFSILKNRDEVITYLNRIDKMLHQGINVNMDLSKSTHADLPTICMLSAYMLDGQHTPTRHLQVSIPPPNANHRVIWDEIQFERMIIRQERRNFSSGRFLSRSDNRVNGDITHIILNDTIEQFGESRKGELRELNSIIGEIFENTTLHAHPRKQKRVPWIINTHGIEGDGYQEREFCIVDLGVGVYDSIRDNVNKWNTKRAKVVHRLTNALDSSSTQSKFLSRHIPTGIGSSTNETTRGKGIRAVHELALANVYSEFDIITNRAHVNLKDISNISRDSSENFNGTIYYWKIRINDN